MRPLTWFWRVGVGSKHETYLKQVKHHLRKCTVKNQTDNITVKIFAVSTKEPTENIILDFEVIWKQNFGPCQNFMTVTNYQEKDQHFFYSAVRN